MIKTIYGINPIIEALSSDTYTVEKIFIQNGRKDKKIKDILTLAKSEKTKIFFLDKSVFNKKFPSINHQGITAEISTFKYFSLDEILSIHRKNKFFLILDSIHDQQNFGNIIRTSEFFGVDAIIITKDKNVKVTDVTVKISAGAIFHIPIIKEINLSQVVKKLKEHFFTIVATAPNHKEDFSIIQNSENIALIIGNEEKGIRPNLLKKSDYVIGLTQSGCTASLNASASAAIFIYEMRKVLENVEG